MDTQPDIKVRSKEHTRQHTDPRTSQLQVNRLIQAELLDIDKQTAWVDGITLTHLMCIEVEEGWLVILKGRKRGRPKAAYVSGRTYAEALELAAEFSTRGCHTWQVDKKPPKGFK